MAGDPVWIDLNFCKFSAPNSGPTVALCELVTNALDAHQAAGIVDSTPRLKIEGQDVVVSDNGLGLSLSSFVIGRPNNTQGTASSLGKFGLGLKDAVAILIRVGATVTIQSSHGNFDFSEREGQCGATTIHVRCTPLDQASAAVVGTTLRVKGLKNQQEVVKSAKTSFLRMCDDVDQPVVKIPNTSIGTIEVYFSPSLGRSLKARTKYSHMFVNGVKKTCSTQLLLQYNIVPGSAQLKLFDRDHHIVEFINFLNALADGINALSETDRNALKELAPQKPSCEFSHKGMRELFFPESSNAGPEQPRNEVISASSSTARIATGNGTKSTNGAATPNIIVLYDYENAHNAMDLLQTHVLKRAPNWHLYVFARCTGIPRIEPMEKIKIIRASTDAAEAADTRLCFEAGKLHGVMSPSTKFLIVCGTEGRYEELKTTLVSAGRQADLLRYDNTKPNEFEAHLGRMMAS